MSKLTKLRDEATALESDALKELRKARDELAADLKEAGPDPPAPLRREAEAHIARMDRALNR